MRKRFKLPPHIEPEDEPLIPVVEENPTQTKQTEREHLMQAQREHEQHEHIRLLHQQGLSIHGIARYLAVARNTVRAHLCMGDELVVASRPKKPSILDPYYDYIVQC